MKEMDDTSAGDVTPGSAKEYQLKPEAERNLGSDGRAAERLISQEKVTRAMGGRLILTTQVRRARMTG